MEAFHVILDRSLTTIYVDYVDWPRPLTDLALHSCDSKNGIHWKYGLGMAMMSSDHIQSAVTALEEAGAKTIIVLPTTTADNSTLTRQWDYIFGLRADSAYLDVPVVESDANFVFTDTPTGHPIMGEIMLDYALEKSEEPSKEVVMIVGHGPQSAEDNARELEILSVHAGRIKEEGGFADVLFGKATAEGKLPFELPRSKEAVEAQMEDVPYDSENPLYPFGAGKD